MITSLFMGVLLFGCDDRPKARASLGSFYSTSSSGCSRGRGDYLRDSVAVEGGEMDVANPRADSGVACFSAETASWLGSMT
jgi:hypothetical protein